MRPIKTTDGLVHLIAGEEAPIRLGLLACLHWYSVDSERVARGRRVAEYVKGRTVLRGDPVTAPVTCLTCAVRVRQ